MIPALRVRGTSSATHVFLGLAILSEMIGRSALKLSEDLTRPLPVVTTGVRYKAAFFLSICLKHLSIDHTWAIWAGVRIVFTASIGFFSLGKNVGLMGITGIGFIITGVLMLIVFSQMSSLYNALRHSIHENHISHRLINNSPYVFLLGQREVVLITINMRFHYDEHE